MKRIHYIPDCDNASGNDTLAVTHQEVMEKVNCPDCLAEMQREGYFGME